MIRTCDKCEGGGLIWVPVGEFGSRAATCWKCSGSGTIYTQPIVQDHTDGSEA